MRNSKKWMSLFMTFVMMCLLVPMTNIPSNAATLTESSFASKLSTEKKNYPNGGKWRGTYYENGRAVAYQCHGYAWQIAYDIFKSTEYTGNGMWSDRTYRKADGSIPTIYAGDVLRIYTYSAGYPDGGSNHTVFVTKVDGENLWYTDANYGNNNGIRWDVKTTRTALKSNGTGGFAYVRHYKGSTLKGTGTGGGSVTLDNPSTETTTYPQPKMLSVKNTRNGKDNIVDVRWELVPGVSKYQVFRADEYTTEKGVEKPIWEPYKICNTCLLNCNADGKLHIVSGNKYTYTVACCDDNGKLLSTYDKTGLSIFYLDPIMKEDLSLSNREGGIKVSWPKISGCTGYYVYRKDGSSGDYKKIATVKDKLYYNDTAVAEKNGKAFYYCVKAYKKDDILSSKAYGQGRCKIRLSQPSISSLTSPSAGKFTVKWNSNSKATGYQVRYSTSSNFSSYKTKTIESNTTVSKSVSSLTKGKKYYVKVRSYKVSSSGTKYYSSWSDAKYVTIK